MAIYSCFGHGILPSHKAPLSRNPVPGTPLKRRRIPSNALFMDTDRRDTSQPTLLFLLRPFTSAERFWLSLLLPSPRKESFQFSPPDGYPLSQAGISSLIRTHLPPCMSPIRFLGSPLVHEPEISSGNNCKASPVTSGSLHAIASSITKAD